jgi:hypothetical protein
VLRRKFRKKTPTITFYVPKFSLRTPLSIADISRHLLPLRKPLQMCYMANFSLQKTPTTTDNTFMCRSSHYGQPLYCGHLLASSPITDTPPNMLHRKFLINKNSHHYGQLLLCGEILITDTPQCGQTGTFQFFYVKNKLNFLLKEINNF